MGRKFITFAIALSALALPLGRQAEAVPASSRPFFMAGPQCSDSGAGYVRWRVQNTESEVHHVMISVDGVDVAGPIKVKPRSGRSGNITSNGPTSAVHEIGARWVDGESGDSAALFMHLSNCAAGEPRGPWFIAGQYCKDGVNKVRFKIRNTADEAMDMRTTVTDHFNLSSTRIWPSNVSHKTLETDVKITKNRKIPPKFGTGEEVRVRGWWLTGDPSNHSRVGFELLDCSNS